MRCADFENRWNDLIDQRHQPRQDASLLAHARHCAACAELLNNHEPLFELLADGVPDLPADFSRRTLTLHQRECAAAELAVAAPSGAIEAGAATGDGRPGEGGGRAPLTAAGGPSRVSRRWHTLPSGVLAGIVLLAALLPVIQPWKAMERRAASPVPPSVAQAPAGQASESPGQGPRGARNGAMLATLPPRSRKTENAVPSETPAALAAPASAAQTPIRSSDELRQILVELWTSFPDLPHAPLEPIDRIAGGIRPLTMTLTAAWDALRRTLPGHGESSSDRQPQAQSFDFGACRLS